MNKDDTSYKFYNILISLLRFISVILSTCFLGYIEPFITKSEQPFFSYIFPITYLIVTFLQKNHEIEFFNRHYIHKDNVRNLIEIQEKCIKNNKNNNIRSTNSNQNSNTSWEEYLQNNFQSTGTKTKLKDLSKK